MNIHVNIDRLVLDGLPVTKAGAGHVQAALEGEIRRVLMFSALTDELRQGGATNVKTATLDVGTIDNPGDFGRRIAHAVCRSLSLSPAPADHVSRERTVRGTRP